MIPFGSGSRSSPPTRSGSPTPSGCRRPSRRSSGPTQKPVQNKLGLLNLATGETITVDAIESFSFSPDGAYLAIRPYGPDGGRAREAERRLAAVARAAARVAATRRRLPRSGRAPRSSSATWRRGRETAFGNVSQFAWQDADAGAPARARHQRGGQDRQRRPAVRPRHRRPACARLVAVDLHGPGVAKGLRRPGGAPGEDRRQEGRLDLRGAGLDRRRAARRSCAAYDPLADKAFPAGHAHGVRAAALLVRRRPDDLRRHREVGRQARAGRAAAAAAAEPPTRPSTIEIWHAKDIVVMPKQKIDAASDRRRSLLAAWHLESRNARPARRRTSPTNR